jgi:hypothetical protein
MTRLAACSCGQLHLTIEGEPSRKAMCHCLACQQRTGAVISNQARFRDDQVTINGKSKEWKRTADSGNVMTFHFCPTCGSTVFWENGGFPGLISVAIGNFADPKFPSADPLSVGGIPTPVGHLAAQHTAKACGEAKLTMRGRQPTFQSVGTG